MIQGSIAAPNRTQTHTPLFLIRWEISTSINQTVTSLSSSWREKWRRRYVLVWIDPTLSVPSQRGLNSPLLKWFHCWMLSGEAAEGTKQLEERHVINEGWSDISYKQQAGRWLSLLPRSPLHLWDVEVSITSCVNVQSATPRYMQRPSETPGSSKRHLYEFSKTRKTPLLSKGQGVTKTMKTPMNEREVRRFKFDQY